MSGDSRRLAQIDALARNAHAGQVDKQGVDYIDHPRAVAASVSDRAKAVALLHDVIEDTELGARNLRHLLSRDELDAVLLVTREPGDSYAEFIGKIAVAPGLAGSLAREVKIADIKHNLGRITPELERLKQRYVNALQVLERNRS